MLTDILNFRIFLDLYSLILHSSTFVLKFGNSEALVQLYAILLVDVSHSELNHLLSELSITECFVNCHWSPDHVNNHCWFAFLIMFFSSFAHAKWKSIANLASSILRLIFLGDGLLFEGFDQFMFTHVDKHFPY